MDYLFAMIKFKLKKCKNMFPSNKTHAVQSWTIWFHKWHFPFSKCVSIIIAVAIVMRKYQINFEINLISSTINLISS